MQGTLIVIAMFIAGVCAPLTSFAQNLSVGNWIMNVEELTTTQDSLSSGQVVRQWNEICRAQDFGNPLRNARQLAIMHTAMHDAVNGVDARYKRHLSTLSDPSADAEAAAAAAAHKVLVNFFPANQAALDAELANSLSMIPDGPAKTAGVALGAAIGQEAFDARLNDGFSSVDPFVPPVGVGFWKPTPPVFAPIVEPQFQNVTPFGIKSRDQFEVKAQKALILTHSKYTAEFNEVQEIGRIDSTTRTADQTHYAHFWFEGSQLGWSKIANIISINENYDLHETARLLALVHMSMCDGFIAGWYWKRVHAFWRPVTAIHEADTDGNPETIQDAGWNSLRPTPASPDYPLTHSVLGGAASEVIRRFTGTDNHSFCFVSTTSVPAGSQRCYTSLSQARQENADSRVVVGIHFRTAVEQGVRLGKKIGKYTIKHNLRALDDDDGDSDSDPD
jgi:hypothetical protein